MKRFKLWLESGVATLIAAFTLSSCSVPLMIPANATCEYLVSLHRAQREEVKEAYGTFLIFSSMQQLGRIEAAISAKGCLMPDGPSLGNASSNASPNVPYGLIEEAASALHAAAPEEFTRFASSAPALQAMAPSQSNTANAANLALFIAAPSEFVAYQAAWRALYDAAPKEFSAISAEQKVLHANIAPEQYAELRGSGKALRSAAPQEFMTCNNAWQMLRSSAPDEFSAYANAQKSLYAVAPVQFVQADEASFALYAAARDEFTVLEYAALLSGIMETLREVAPLEFRAYMAANSGATADEQTSQALANAAPKNSWP